ncbi:GH3 auxin-responsive promoter family protein [Croceimicrobium hydrocarbonivorans]|uniref:GH3 auxin-responsive promoter family protein n=1 Tax=Croceimicrobium hydrocarbonivorans TaxID=2761580 RepID=A0A7H0VBH6_9FLAO|nr:GH3 auxin-responsive promoter family protein [Croceimicrobium hydrocarbonivorans]QNR23074.1 GH3 auxin-responsive promoter family protein [Croceimicrobium hydrocarbonivorans]
MKLDLVNSFLSWRMKKRYHQLELFMKYPHEVQAEVLQNLLGTAAQTEWGKRYDFKSIGSNEEFRDRIPLHRYEDIEPEVQRIRDGADNVMWPGDIRWFAKSSGTTNAKSKFLPVSNEHIEDCHFKGGKDLLSIYCNLYPETTIFSGMNLRLGGSTFVDNEEINSYYGDVSAIIIENLPFWVEMRSTPSNKISLMQEWEAKIEAMSTTSMREDVTSLAGVPSWMMVLLERVLDISGKKHIIDVWPNLELYMHGGVSFAPYRSQFKELIGKDINYLETYNASEGFFGIQDQKESEDMLLMLDYGIYYEFIPMDQFDGTNSKTIGLEEVKLNTNYAVVISTNAGLWRYLIGDTIRFSSISPYRFRISGRTKHFINVFGEELIIENAESALTATCNEMGARIHEYTAAPIFMQRKESGAHQWLIEFEQEPNSLEEFAQLLDQKLCGLNSDYEAKRHKGMALKPLEVISARKGLFYDWLKQKGKLGGQNKVPRLSNSREHIEELLALQT